MKPRPSLRSFRLHNFKAVRDSGTVTFGPLTVFIGNNGSGKSSLIEGLETFRVIVLDGLDPAMNRWHGFEHVWNQAQQHELLRPAGDRPCHTNPMIFRINFRTDGVRLKVDQEINLGEGGEELFIQKEHVVRASHGPSEQFTRNAHGKLVSNELDGSGQYADLPRRLAVGRSLLKDMAGDALERWQFLSLVPDVMGQPVPQQRAAGKIRLAKNGANIAEYLHEIRKLDASAFEGILDSLRYVLPFAKDLQPTLASELERAFYLNLKEENFEVPGWLLSTGTLRIVALLACLRHPQPPPVLVVEEIENGLDPRTLHLLVEEIRAATATRGTQVILTTHSPYLLDLLDLSQIVVVERADGEPRFTRPDQRKLAEWASSFSPGRLYTMGRFSRGA